MIYWTYPIISASPVLLGIGVFLLVMLLVMLLACLIVFGIKGR